MGDTFQRHQAEIAASLEPVEKQLGVVSKALEQFDLQSHELYDLQVAIEGNIQQQIQQLQELLEARKAELIDQLQQYIRVMLLPCELANVKFKATPKLTQACQQFGDVYLSKVSPEKCYATGKGLTIAKFGERATAVLHIVDQLQTPIETLICKFVPEALVRRQNAP